MESGFTLYDNSIMHIFTAEADGGGGGGGGGGGRDVKTVLNCPNPVAKYCYYCKRVVWTKIKYYPTLKTRIIAMGLSFCLLCWVPFFCHWKSEVDHHCSFCDSYLGTYDPILEQYFFDGLNGSNNNNNNNNNNNGNVATDEKQQEDAKQPQKKYREVGRRCGEYGEKISRREDLIRECSKYA